MEKKDNLTARVLHLEECPNAHSHVHHQIIFGLTGHAEFEISGMHGYIQKCVGCIVPSNHHHTFFGNRKNKIMILDITGNLGLLEINANLINNVLSSILDSPKYFQFDQEMHTLLKALANEIETLPSNSAASTAIAQCLLHSLYHRLRDDISLEDVSSICERINLPRIKRHIYGNLSEKIHTADLARLCNLSESHFFQKFREATGVSPYQYVIDQRIQVAAKMISESNKPITEICFSLGFSSQSAFTNAFRKKVNMSPTEFRHQQSNLVN